MRRDVVPVYFLEVNIVGLAIHRYLPPATLGSVAHAVLQ